MLIPGRGLLTTASDEPFENLIPGGRREPPLCPALFGPAPSRGPLGSITPQAKVRRPYARASPGRRGEKSPGAFRRARRRTCPWALGRLVTLEKR